MPFFLLILTFILILSETCLLAVRSRGHKESRVASTSPSTEHIAAADDAWANFVKNTCCTIAESSGRNDITFNFTSIRSEIPFPSDSGRLLVYLSDLLSAALRYAAPGGYIQVSVRAVRAYITITLYTSDSAESEMYDREVFSIGIPAAKILSPETQQPQPTRPGNEETEIANEADTPAPTSSLDSQEAVEETDSLPTAEEEKAGKKPALLIAAPDTDCISSLIESIEGEFSVTATGSGDEIAERAEGLPPAVILACPDDKEADGPTLCRHIKSNSILASVPMVIVTASKGDDATVRTLTTGADDCIMLPADTEQAVAKLKRLTDFPYYGSNPLICPEPVNSDIPPLDDILLEKAVRYVVTNIRRPDLSVEELSAHLGMSRVHLYKKLKAATGKTPIEFIRLIRMKRAAQMLRESRMNISDIAFKLGYNTPKIFSRYFKEEFGVLPSVYQG